MTVLLDHLLEDISPYLNDKAITDISLNRPGELWLDDGATSRAIKLPALSYKKCRSIADQIATLSEQKVCEETPLLSAHLPNGERVQAVIAPATLWIDEDNVPSPTVSFSIRKNHTTNLELSAYDKKGGFSFVGKRHEQAIEHANILKTLHTEKSYKDFLRYAVKNHQTILISGATYSGKTAFLNMLLKEIPSEERLITIEDVPELQLKQPNRVRLFYSRGSQGLASSTSADLVLATLRMRPDRIILGELRGEDAYHWLTAANSGHPGTLATIHADEPKKALEKLARMAMAVHASWGFSETYQYVLSIVDIVVQLKRNADGTRFVSDILLTNSLQ